MSLHTYCTHIHENVFYFQAYCTLPLQSKSTFTVALSQETKSLKLFHLLLGGSQVAPTNNALWMPPFGGVQRCMMG